MADEKSKVAERGMEFARELQVKFEVYFTGLIFTLLAASIQTAKFTYSPLANAFEMAGWIALLIAGLAGLSRFEWLPTDHDVQASLREAQDIMDTWRDVERRGGRVVNENHEVHDVASILQKQKDSIDKVLLHIKTRDKISGMKHEVRKYCFVFGLCSIITSRACEPMYGIWNHLLGL